MAGRVLELALKIKGKLESSYPESLRQALAKAKALEGKYGTLANKIRQAQNVSNANGNNKYLQEQTQLINKLAGLNALKEQSAQYAALKNNQALSNQKFAEAKNKVKELGGQYQQAQMAMSQLKARQQEVKITLDQSQKATNKYKNELQGLKSLRSKMETEAAASGKSKNDLKLNEQYKQIQNQIKQTAEALRQSQSATKTAQSDYRILSSGVRQAESELQRFGAAFAKAKSDAKGLGSSLANELSTMKQLQSTLNAAGYSTQNFGASQLKLRTEIAQATAEMQKQAAAQAKMQQIRQKSMNFDNAKNNLTSAVSTAQQLAEPLTSAIDKAMTFEHAMSKVKALTQGENIRNGNFKQVEADMQTLEAQAKQLGATTQFTMTQAADAMGFLGMAGWKTTQITNAMPGMLNLAAASGSDLARTADIVSDNMTAMGLTAGQMVRTGKNLDKQVEASQHFMDVYAYAMSNSNVNLETLGETMKYAAPIANAYGASLEDTAAMTMIMGNAGIKGSMAGTALRMGLLRLSGPPKKATKEMDALGISMSDATKMAYETQAQLQALGIHLDENAPPADKMNQVLMQLSTKMQGLSRDEKLAAVGAIFGANAASGWVNILSQGPEAFQNYRNALRDCDGYAKQMAYTMNDDARGSMIAFQSAVEAVQVNFGQAFLGSLRSVLETITPVITSIAKWITKNQELAVVIGGTAAALIALAVAIAAFGAISAGMTYAITTIQTAMLALRSITISSMFSMITSMLPVIAVVALIAAAAYLIYQNWSTVGPYLQSLWNTISGAVQTAWSTIQPAISQISTAFQTLMTSIGGSQSIVSLLIGGFATLGTAIAGILATVITTAANFVAMIIGVLGGITTFITGVLAADWSTAWQG
ncbi:MAG: phage tail tape measure protein, partial [Selenomonadaceae bacterium]|nr:phage tail tape measure protein [Selenomonadaceae bacterium]